MPLIKLLHGQLKCNNTAPCPKCSASLINNWRTNSLVNPLFIVSLAVTTILHFVVFTNKSKQIHTVNAAFQTAQISPFASLCKYIVSTHFLFFPLAHFNAVFLPNHLKVCKTHQHFSKGQDGHLSAITSNTFPPSISIALRIPHDWLANHYSKSYFQNK